MTEIFFILGLFFVLEAPVILVMAILQFLISSRIIFFAIAQGLYGLWSFVLISALFQYLSGADAIGVLIYLGGATIVVISGFFIGPQLLNVFFQKRFPNPNGMTPRAALLQVFLGRLGYDIARQAGATLPERKVTRVKGVSLYYIFVLLLVSGLALWHFSTL